MRDEGTIAVGIKMLKLPKCVFTTSVSDVMYTYGPLVFVKS